MASGTLGQASLAATTNTTVYTCVGSPVTFNVNMYNTTGYPIAVNLGVCASATPNVDGSEYIEFQTVILPNSALERGGIVATAGKRVVAYANYAGISVNVYGFEG
jgi:hypothetical protein